MVLWSAVIGYSLVQIAVDFCSKVTDVLQATGDSYYLDVGKKVIENLNKYARVTCGFAALKDVTAKTHEDQYVITVCVILCCVLLNIIASFMPNY